MQIPYTDQISLYFFCPLQLLIGWFIRWLVVWFTFKDHVKSQLAIGHSDTINGWGIEAEFINSIPTFGRERQEDYYFKASLMVFYNFSWGHISKYLFTPGRAPKTKEIIPSKSSSVNQ